MVVSVGIIVNLRALLCTLKPHAASVHAGSYCIQQYVGCSYRSLVALPTFWRLAAVLVQAVPNLPQSCELHVPSRPTTNMCEAPSARALSLLFRPCQSFSQLFRVLPCWHPATACYSAHRWARLQHTPDLKLRIARRRAHVHPRYT